MIARILLPLMACLCPCFGQTESNLSLRLKSAIDENWSYSLQPPVENKTETAEEPILRLEPFKVTGTPAFHLDLIMAAQRDAAAREALKFSLLTGGLIFTKKIGSVRLDLGIWPMLKPQISGQIGSSAGNQQFVGLSVDLLRLKW